MRAWSGVVLGVGFLLVPAALWAQQGRTQVREGNRLYAEGRYEEAREKYLDALREAPNAPLIRFNEANTLYQTEEFQSALDGYRQAVETGDPSLQAKSWYNLGNALYRQQQLQQSVDAYKEALRIDPSDVDAKHNLELALEQLEQQQQQQQQQQQDDQGDQQGDSQQDQQDQDQQEQQQQQQQQQDQGQQQQSPEEQQAPQQSEQPQPREMSREEAARLLQAINEDPNEVQRQRMRGGPPRKVAKDW